MGHIAPWASKVGTVHATDNLIKEIRQRYCFFFSFSADLLNLEYKSVLFHFPITMRILTSYKLSMARRNQSISMTQSSGIFNKNVHEQLGIFMLKINHEFCLNILNWKWTIELN